MRYYVPMRVLHFSDPHLDPDLSRVPLGEWPGKRLIGAANLLLNRRRLFDAVQERLAALDRFREEQQVDLVLCTGDYTVLGTRHEMERAREAVEPLTGAPLGYLTVPGNHDLYMPDTLRDDRFQEFFGDLSGEGAWPRVTRVGPGVAVVGVNSARPNPQPWRSSGVVPREQLEELNRILALPDLQDRFVFVMTHYAPRLWNGRPDHPSHGMVNAEAFLEVCKRIRRGAILCGHIHRRYRIDLPGWNASIFCAGSVSQKGREGLWLFDVDRDRATAAPGRWDGNRFQMVPGEAYDL